MRKSRFLAGLAALAAGAAGLPAHAQTPVPVSLTNPGGSRVVVVENVDGTALTKLDFGTGRSLPFKVRVVDDKFDRKAFTVSATMTNLYGTDDLGNVDYTKTPIHSADVALGSLSPVSALDVKAVVQPLLTTVTTITDPVICHVLGLTALLDLGPCTINATDVTGKLVELTLPSDVLSQLPKLPLVPQPVETGTFDEAEYGTNTLGIADPGKPAVPNPTSLQVLGGDASPVDLSALDTLLDGLNTAALLDPSALLAKLGQTLPLASLLPAQVTTLLASTTATAKDLTLSNILNQTGTYVSLPTLNVTIPDGAGAGDYKGTLVVTALQ